MKTYIVSSINSKVALLSALFTEEVILGTRLSAKWRDLGGGTIYSLSSFSQRFYFKINASSSKCSPKLFSRLKEVWRIFSTKTILLERPNGSFFTVRWIFKNIIIIKAKQAHSRTNTLRKDFFPVAKFYSRIEYSWKEPHRFFIFHI